MFDNPTTPNHGASTIPVELKIDGIALSILVASAQFRILTIHCEKERIAQNLRVIAGHVQSRYEQARFFPSSCVGSRQ